MNKLYKILSSGLLVLAVSAAQAQVKVGDNPATINANSALEIESTDKGLLLPRVELVALDNPAPLSAHVKGMTVFNTNVTDDLYEGIYLNDGNMWVQLQNTEVFETNTFGPGAPTGTCAAGTIYTDTLETSATVGQQWTCSGGTWVTYKTTVNSPFYRAGTTIDVGAGKVANISRFGSITAASLDGTRSSTLFNNGGLQLYRSATAPLNFVNGFIDFKKDLGAGGRYMRISMSSIAALSDWAIRFESRETPWIMAMLANGNVGIKTFAPTAVLSVNGDANKPGGGSWAVFSDFRSKENIESYNRGISELMKINPVSFQYKKSMGWDTQRHVGVIAQEIENVLPEVIREIEMGDIKDFKEVDPNEFTYLLINSVKEQQQQLEFQGKQIQDQEVEIAALRMTIETRLAQLEQKTGSKQRYSKRISKKKNVKDIAFIK